VQQALLAQQVQVLLVPPGPQVLLDPQEPQVLEQLALPAYKEVPELQVPLVLSAQQAVQGHKAAQAPQVPLASQALLDLVEIDILLPLPIH